MTSIAAAPIAGTPFDSGSLAFLFTDIEGSTKRWEKRPRAMEAAVARHDRVMRTIFVARGGHVFKTMGDAFCVTFAGASVALAAAIEAQHALAAEDFSEVDGIRVRMAIHVGEVQARDCDYFGQPVNRVARLLSIAHGEQLILSGAAAALARDNLPEGVALRDLGEHRLKDLAQPEAVFQVEGPGLRSEFPALRSLSALQHNLPFQATSFVGREAELAEVKSLVGQHRLVTLLGAGGLGKTRLAMQAGADLLTQYPDGVWLVELAPLSAAPLFGETLAAIFGLSVQSGSDAAAQVVTYLRQKKLLLIFDNCEHLLEEAARIAALILKSAADVRILASSRERLGIAGESVYRVPAFGVPESGAILDRVSALEFPAVRLFVERASLVLGRFELTDENASDVAELCRRLDGIALAIELAVPRLKMLKPRELLARLNDRFRMLTGGDRSALPRQQTLKALIEWSYNLLEETERLALRRLSVFGGAITIDDAAAVITDDQLDEWAVFDLLTALLEKSLLSPLTDDHGESRYRLLESTRAYGIDKLKESGEEPIFRRRLAEFLITKFRTADTEYPTAPTESWLATYRPELDNLRAALDWCFGPGGEKRLGVELVSYSLLFWEELSLSLERTRWLEVAAAALDGSEPPGIVGRIILGQAATTRYGNRHGIEALQRAISLFREAKEPLWLGRALCHAGVACARPRDVEEAASYCREAEAILRPLGPTKNLSTLLNLMGTVHAFSGDDIGSRRLCDESLALKRKLGDQSGIIMILLNLAEAEFSTGNLGRAIEFAKEAEISCRRKGDRIKLGLFCANFAGYMIANDQFIDAKSVALEGLILNVALNQDHFAICCLEHLALVYAIEGNLKMAAKLAGFGDSYYKREKLDRESTESVSWYKLLGILNSKLSIGEMNEHFRDGAGFTLRTLTDALVKL